MGMYVQVQTNKNSAHGGCLREWNAGVGVGGLGPRRQQGRARWAVRRIALGQLYVCTHTYLYVVYVCAHVIYL